MGARKAEMGVGKGWFEEGWRRTEEAGVVSGKNRYLLYNKYSWGCIKGAEGHTA